MDWLSFAGAIIGGLIGGLFTFLGVKITLRHDDKKRKEEEIKQAIEKRPRLELIKYKDLKESKLNSCADLKALILHIENVKLEGPRIRFEYDKRALDNKELVCFDYNFKNTGATEIDDISLVCTLPRDTAVIDYDYKQTYLEEDLLNYAVWSNKRFIKPGESVSIKIFYLKDKIISGTLGCAVAIYIRDINGRYWHQPLFAPGQETDNSTLVSFKQFKDSSDIDTAIKCFRGELPW